MMKIFNTSVALQFLPKFQIGITCNDNNVVKNIIFLYIGIYLHFKIFFTKYVRVSTLSKC